MPIGFKEFGKFLAKAIVVLISLASCTPNPKSSGVANGDLRLSCHVIERIPQVKISSQWQSKYLPEEFKLITKDNNHLLGIDGRLVTSDSTGTKGKLSFVIKELSTSSQKTTTIQYLIKIDMSNQPAIATIELRPNKFLKLMTGKAICRTL